MKKALTIAASDPSGGAGVEADLKVMAAHKVFGMTAITAITAQSSKGVKSVNPVSPELFKQVLETLLEDRPIHAVKTGALATEEHVRIAADFIDKIKPASLVVDPALSPTVGPALLEQNGLDALCESLVPRASLICPNLMEAQALTGIEVLNLEGMIEAGRLLVEWGAGAALVKGGHLSGGPKDVFVTRDFTRVYEGRRLEGEFHGTGCALSSAIACRLALGDALEDAVQAARRYLVRCMERALPGAGKMKLLNHFSST